ncbi:Sec34-domain-containing protein [Terfezia boudieri ATCC MYA-4762]|uniref:Conserved oligomeric Golgi complex subunit 3 n=1 Tax=Terfezia boudieri ATCC MYA-4762 TaxID=1051890 RepID=A0A3N4LUU6_9PEZI|nr:Sec34-domain-containing protein [Terfezia boudieri ATCC MYA-4762]
MFEDHWYEHSTPLPQATLNLWRSESTKRQSFESPRSSRDDAKGRAKTEVPLRPKSRNDMEDGQGGHRSSGWMGAKEFTKELDLMQWYDDMESELQDASNDEYKCVHIAPASGVSRLLEITDDTLLLLSSLKNSFVAVENQTSSFQTQCEDLVTEEQRLEALSQQIGQGLAPFAELENMITKLNRPGTDFVKTRSFSDMLKTLDWCLEDLSRYTHFKDTPIYLPKFRRCMTISMTLIRNFLVNSLRETSTDVSKRMAAQNLTETTQSALLYARFRVNAPELRDLVGEIEKRCPGHEEYISLLNDCYNAFFASRRPLITPLTTKKMTNIAAASANSSDLVVFARFSISDMRSICNDEFELFYAYFSTGEREVYTFLESICKPFYDRLRPKIAAEAQLVKLCELCTLLQTRYLRDQEDPDYDQYDRSRLDFGRLIQTILLETQTRLVAGAQGVLKTAIEQFVPTTEDLDYPAKVANQPKRKGIAAPVVIETDENLGTAGGFDTDAVFQGWYPTMRKAIWLLSRIYRLVNPAVFGDIAHKIVHSCTLSLIKASKQLNKQKTPIDGHLFLIKHLLILKEQIVAFDIEYLPPDQERVAAGVQETLTGTFWDVYQQGGLLTRDGILKLVSVGAGWTSGPVENMIDAKVELDGTLRTAITSLTAEFSAMMLSPILSASSAEPITPQLPEKSGGQLMQEIQGNVEKKVRELRDRLKEYMVGDWRTREALVGAVQELVINKYEAFFSQLLQDTSGGSISYRDVWDVERFIGWSNEVFDVGKGVLGGGMHDGGGEGEGEGEGEGLGIAMNGEEGEEGDDDYTESGGEDGEDGGK